MGTVAHHQSRSCRTSTGCVAQPACSLQGLQRLAQPLVSLQANHAASLVSRRRPHSEGPALALFETALLAVAGRLCRAAPLVASRCLPLFLVFAFPRDFAVSAFVFRFCFFTRLRDVCLCFWFLRSCQAARACTADRTHAELLSCLDVQSRRLPGQRAVHRDSTRPAIPSSEKAKFG